jgi:hypothetical protein
VSRKQARASKGGVLSIPSATSPSSMRRRRIEIHTALYLGVRSGSSSMTLWSSRHVREIIFMPAAHQHILYRTEDRTALEAEEAEERVCGSAYRAIERTHRLVQESSLRQRRQSPPAVPWRASIGRHSKPALKPRRHPNRVNRQTRHQNTLPVRLAALPPIDSVHTTSPTSPRLNLHQIISRVPKHQFV